jgi:hypothetical protein
LAKGTAEWVRGLRQESEARGRRKENAAEPIEMKLLLDTTVLVDVLRNRKRAGANYWQIWCALGIPSRPLR